MRQGWRLGRAWFFLTAGNGIPEHHGGVDLEHDAAGGEVEVAAALKDFLLALTVAYRRGMDDAEAWVPEACTLPTADRPFRVAEFDDLLAGAVRHRPERTRLVVELDPRPEVAARAADLAVRETGCCSFFTFDLTMTGGGVRLAITVPDSQTGVLDALAVR